MTLEDEVEMRLSLLTDNGEWFGFLGRPNPARYDIYSGPYIKLPEKFSNVDFSKNQGLAKECGLFINENLSLKFHKQICHFHPISPIMKEVNPNTQNDMAFILRAPKLIRELLNKIKSLELEIGEKNK